MHNKPSFRTQKIELTIKRLIAEYIVTHKEFLIEFLTIGVDNSYETNKYIPQIKFCVCTAVNTNFTGTGWRSFKDGAPTEITLQLTFQETEIITGEDV